MTITASAAMIPMPSTLASSGRTLVVPVPPRGARCGGLDWVVCVTVALPRATALDGRRAPRPTSATLREVYRTPPMLRRTGGPGTMVPGPPAAVLRDERRERSSERSPHRVTARAQEPAIAVRIAFAASCIDLVGSAPDTMSA